MEGRNPGTNEILQSQFSSSSKLNGRKNSDLWKEVFQYGLILLAILFNFNLFAQEEEDYIKISDNEMKLSINLNWDRTKIEIIANSFQLDSSLIQAIINHDFSIKESESGWRLKSINNKQIILVKELETSGSPGKHSREYFFFNDDFLKDELPVMNVPVIFGYNYQKLTSIIDLPTGITIFKLPSFQNAGQVYLSGTFNAWSTLSHPMKKSTEGWELELELEPGKHLYKFIVDGKWMRDPNNKNKEPDLLDDFNSVYFKTNFCFRLDGFANARKVHVAGTFNAWNQRDCRMQKNETGWELPVYIQEGMYGYKFIVDDDWIIDPTNPQQREDALGNQNSILSFGPKYQFQLVGFKSAETVVLAGNFNNWSSNEFVMERTDYGWFIDYVLPPGRYEYKFVVDGKWMLDPGNNLTIGEGDFVNSVLFVNPNYTFYLSGFEYTEAVFVTGSFCNWTLPGFPMIRDYEGWILPVYLTRGKHLYKYLISDELILDPENPMWEPNEFGTGNSILWIE